MHWNRKCKLQNVWETLRFLQNVGHIRAHVYSSVGLRFCNSIEDTNSSESIVYGFDMNEHVISLIIG